MFVSFPLLKSSKMANIQQAYLHKKSQEKPEHNIDRKSSQKKSGDTNNTR